MWIYALLYKAKINYYILHCAFFALENNKEYCRINFHTHLPNGFDCRDMWATLITGANLHDFLCKVSLDVPIPASQTYPRKLPMISLRIDFACWNQNT